MDTATEVRRRESVVITAKIRPPELPPGVVERRRLTELLGRSSRVIVVAAPPGYGKTVLIRQHVDVVGQPVAWVSFDLFDESPISFWLHVVRAVREVVAEVDEEAELALREDRQSERFLAVLISQIERASRSFTLVLDDVALWASSRIHDGLKVLVERVGHLVRLVISARAEPRLPLARWRANGWLVDIREDDLRLTDDEALAAAATFERRIPRDTVVALNRRVEGWPIGLHLALVSAYEAPDPGASALALVRSDRLLGDYIVAEVLDALPPRHREVALILSVVTGFDADLCHRLAGADANDIVADLERRRVVIASTGSPRDGTWFHRLFRELLESELRWRDPALHADVHRAAATIWRERGNVNAADRHLVAAGDTDAANAIVGHGPRVDGLLVQQPLDRLHPALFQHYRPNGTQQRYRPVASEHVTARELTILVLLPSHLSYSQIGRELHLSVNTVKSNLKSIYRKLAVSNRSDAVDVAREAHLI